MKLNYKRTFLIGLAFMSISAFWQMYDFTVPLILLDGFHVPEIAKGVIMALDNVLALFLLPLLGTLSDKVSTPTGKRMPFILGGTAVAAVAMIGLPLLDNAHYADPSKTYTFPLFVVLLGVLLLAMATYRSPAVALMPDLTPKPLRSKANAVINLMGAVGGVIFLILSTLMFTEKNVRYNYLPVYLIIAGLMVVSVLVLFLTIKENKLSAEVKAYEAEHPEDDLTVVDETKGVILPKPVRRSLIFILSSIFLWFMGYNAVTTAFSKYAESEWGMTAGAASLCLTIATAGAIVSYIPIGMIASKVGRKRTILIGVVGITAAFATAAIYTALGGTFAVWLYGLFILIGFSWAAINVNSLPMVVEMCRDSDVGKYTGLYYTFSMSAQILTPILSSVFISFLGYRVLFTYSAVFLGLAFVTMLFVRHGDNKPAVPASKLEAFDVED